MEARRPGATPGTPPLGRQSAAPARHAARAARAARLLPGRAQAAARAPARVRARPQRPAQAKDLAITECEYANAPRKQGQGGRVGCCDLACWPGASAPAAGARRRGQRPRRWC